MADGFDAVMEAAEVVAALIELGDFAQPYINDASGESAVSMENEAVARLRRQLGPNATGETEAGIQSRAAIDGNGYIVESGNDRMPNLPLWIDKGTKKGRPGSSTQAARNFFFVSAELEKGAHRRRISDALQQSFSDRGLGD